MTIEFKAIEFDTASEAIQHDHAQGGDAVLMDGRYLVIDKITLDRLAERGVEFAYLIDHEMPDGTHRMMTIPVND